MEDETSDGDTLHLPADHPLMEHISRLAETWRAEAEVLRRHGCEAAGQALEQRADEAVEAVRAYLTEALTPADAAEETGYSPKHLRELARQEEIPVLRPNGPGGRMLLPRFGLPRKPEAAVTNAESIPEDEPEGESPADRAYRRFVEQERETRSANESSTVSSRP